MTVTDVFFSIFMPVSCYVSHQWMFMAVVCSAGLRSEAQEARLQMRETQRKMSELNAVSFNGVKVQTLWLC